jgi:hypothetical protein
LSGILAHRAFPPNRRCAADRPAAAERHEQRGGIGETIGFGLHADYRGGQVGLLRIENRELIDLPGAELLLDDIEAGLCSIFGMNSGLDRAGIGLQGAQGIRHILERGNDGGSVLGFGLFERGLAFCLL